MIRQIRKDELHLLNRCIRRSLHRIRLEKGPGKEVLGFLEEIGQLCPYCIYMDEVPLENWN